jgi:hypothetical protein
MPDLTCPDCDEELDTSLDQCENCGHELTLAERNPNISAVIFLVLLMGLGWWGWTLIPESEPVKLHSEEWGDQNWSYAWGECQRAVRQKLRAPSTAEFPTGMQYTSYLGNGDYFIEAHVDAENAMGGTVRVQWMCSVEHREEGGWAVQRVETK